MEAVELIKSILVIIGTLLGIYKLLLDIGEHKKKKRPDEDAK